MPAARCPCPPPSLHCAASADPTSPTATHLFARLFYRDPKSRKAPPSRASDSPPRRLRSSPRSASRSRAASSSAALRGTASPRHWPPTSRCRWRRRRVSSTWSPSRTRWSTRFRARCRSRCPPRARARSAAAFSGRAHALLPGPSGVGHGVRDQGRRCGPAGAPVHRHGHQVWTTIHVHSANAILFRLLDMGVGTAEVCKPGNIELLMKQTLLPRLCEACALTEPSGGKAVPDWLGRHLRSWPLVRFRNPQGWPGLQPRGPQCSRGQGLERVRPSDRDRGGDPPGRRLPFLRAPARPGGRLGPLGRQHGRSAHRRAHLGARRRQAGRIPSMRSARAHG